MRVANVAPSYVIDEDMEIIPTTSSSMKADGTMISKPLEDMYPFLDREEFKNAFFE